MKRNETQVGTLAKLFIFAITRFAAKLLMHSTERVSKQNFRLFCRLYGTIARVI